jgi:hypothetical protein
LTAPIEQTTQVKTRQTPNFDNDPIVITQFYYSHALPYLMHKHHQEIGRRLKDVPSALRQRELVPYLAQLGETSGDAAWQVFLNYLDKIERCIGATVRHHSPTFWFHLHRRIYPTLAKIHEGKTDETTVRLVRNIAELAYAKHGSLDRTDDLGPILRTRLKTFLDGAWYEATANALGSKLKAQKLYQQIKRTPQVVMTDFHVSDLLDVYGVEGLCYEYWWASAAMRSIGKGSIVKWDATKTPSLQYKDTEVNPLCFEIYDDGTAKAKVSKLDLALGLMKLTLSTKRRLARGWGSLRTAHSQPVDWGLSGLEPASEVGWNGPRCYELWRRQFFTTKVQERKRVHGSAIQGETRPRFGPRSFRHMGGFIFRHLHWCDNPSAYT